MRARRSLPVARLSWTITVQPGRGGFGPGGTVEDLRHWLVDARLEDTTVESSGLFAYFEGAKP